MSSTNPGSHQAHQADANPSYKDQLDESASKVKYDSQNNNNNNGNRGGLVDQVAEKVSQYVPALGNVLGGIEEEETNKRNRKEDGDGVVPGPPHRPHHDTQIEEFVRDQHRSKTEEGTLAGE